MIYAPIYITTLCRDKHFVREIESLKRNKWACYTDVYIALDYPANEKHRDGYNNILKYLETSDFSQFASFHIVKREHNYGPSKNSGLMREYIMNLYDRWIVAEDDLEFSPNFIEYMDKCLMQYENDDAVLGINGYTYPINWESSEGSTVLKQYGTFSCWGCGFWKNKYLKVRHELENNYLHEKFKAAVKSKKLGSMVGGRKYDYINFALSGNSNSLFHKCSDMALGIYMGLNNLCVITPIISKVKNYGFDGSGFYCNKINTKDNKNSLSYDYESQIMDIDDSFNIVMDLKDDWQSNRIKLNKFLHVTNNDKLRAFFLMLSFRIVGQERTCKLYQKLKSIFLKENKKEKTNVK